VDFFVYQRLAPVYIVANLTGATPSVNFQYATANSHPLRAGKQHRKLIRMAKFITLPFNRKKQSAPGKLVTGNISLVTAHHWFALYVSMMGRVASLIGLNKAGVNARVLGRLAG
jgi:hypothetical protein